jgi:hypothetical protein
LGAMFVYCSRKLGIHTKRNRLLQPKTGHRSKK